MDPLESCLCGLGTRQRCRGQLNKSARCLPACPAATVEGYGEGASTLVSKDEFRFLVDEPVKLGGLGKGGREGSAASSNQGPAHSNVRLCAS